MTGGRADNGYHAIGEPLKLIVLNTGDVRPVGAVLPSLEALVRLQVFRSVVHGTAVSLPGVGDGWAFDAVTEPPGGLIVHVHPPAVSSPAAVIAAGNGMSVRAWGRAMAELDKAGCLQGPAPPQDLHCRWVGVGLLPSAKVFRGCGAWVMDAAALIGWAWHRPMTDGDFAALCARDVDLLHDLDVVESRRGWD